MADGATIRADGPVLCFGGSSSNLQASGVAVLAGRCEESRAAEAGDCGCGFAAGTACDRLARDWYAQARREASARQRAWMAALPRPLVLEIGGVRLAVVHGGAGAISRFLFASASDATLAAEIAATGCDGVIAGHCGLPFSRIVGGRLWHDPGAIGMPANDATPRSWFPVLSPRPGGLRIGHLVRRSAHCGAAAAMRRAGLAPPHAAALVTRAVAVLWRAGAGAAGAQRRPAGAGAAVPWPGGARAG